MHEKSLAIATREKSNLGLHFGQQNVNIPKSERERENKKNTLIDNAISQFTTKGFGFVSVERWAKKEEISRFWDVV